MPATYHHQWVKDVPKNFPGKPFILSESVSALQQKRCAAEARVLRAYDYFLLANLWGTPPLVTKALDPACRSRESASLPQAQQIHIRWYLNPFRDTSNPTSISYGNPDLDTEKAHILGMMI